MRKLKKYKPTRFMAKTSHYDKDAADYAVMFIESLCHTKGTWAGKPFELIDWQEQIIRDLFGVLKPCLLYTSCEGGGKGALIQDNKSATLGCNNDQTVFGKDSHPYNHHNCNNCCKGQ